MKKIGLLGMAAILIILSFITGCKKSPSPTAPSTGVDYTAFVPVPGGTFVQFDDMNSFTHTVSAFKMGKYMVTYDLWYSVYQWAIAHGYTFQNAGTEGSTGTAGAAPTSAKHQPVTTVNWRDVIVWCNAYSQKSGLQPMYCSDAGFTTPIMDSTSGTYSSTQNYNTGSFDVPYINWSMKGYRLPAEGEYVCAASYIDGSNWTPHDYASGATANYIDTAATAVVAWLGSSTENVGMLKANALGIFDMSGNAVEWCWDGFAAYPGTSTDYRGDSSPALGRIMRGGGCCGNNTGLQVGARSYMWTYYTSNDNGLRVAMSN